MAKAKKDPDTNPHAAGTKAAARWESRRAKRLERERRVTLQREAVEKAGAVLVATPRGIADWGIVRTRAWVGTHELLRRELLRTRPRLEKLNLSMFRLDAITAGRLSMANLATLANDPRVETL